MFEKTNRDRVKGFLRAEGTKTVNGDGEEIVLTGWGLGNWLLPEGYMWLSRDSRFDRPRRIEAVIQELTGTAYSQHFWKRFRERYVTREDIKRMAELGYNSVRIPFNWRVLMEDEPGIAWREDGFALIDRCLDWCEEFGLYAFLDLHGAPGGQTGANIDDSIDDFPRLFTDEDSWHKGIELWKELARRYKDRWIVGGYDLLNEPVKPGLWEDKHPHYLLRRLAAFYDEAIAAIRAIDSRHMLSIEGHHWATNTSLFYKRFDNNMVIHFHRYACMPGIEALSEWLALSKHLDQPLWLGETGENIPEWFAALYPLSVAHDIGYNLWPWKKMACQNSPYSIRKPDGWDEFLGYTTGGPRPSRERTQHILDEFLDNLVIENCDYRPAVTASAFRRPGCRLRGTDFDELPGIGVSFSGKRAEGNLYQYRSNTGMLIVPIQDTVESKKFFFDSGWDLLTLQMEAGEFAAYTFGKLDSNSWAELELVCLADAIISIIQDGQEVKRASFIKGTSVSEPSVLAAIPLQAAEESTLKIEVLSGVIQLHSIHVL